MKIDLPPKRRGAAWLGRMLNRFAERRAAVAVIFGLLVIPLLAFVALAFDVGSAFWARAQLNIAADAAALSAVTKGVIDYTNNTQTDFTAAQTAGTQRFNAQTDKMPQVSVKPSGLAVSVTRKGTTITAQVAYTANYQLRFAGLQLSSLGSIPTTFTVRGSSSASRTVSPYFEISILMDNSSSMAIGASLTDMANMGTLVHNSSWYTSWGQSQNCAFGCHFAADGNDFYGLAHKNGVSLRIDVLIQAVTHVLQTIQQSQGAAQFQVALYSFNKGLTTVFPSSSNLNAAISTASTMTVPVTTDGSDADTNITATLQSLASTIPASGDGSTAASPQRYLFIITDGVADYKDSKGNRFLGPIDPNQCTPLKTKGIQVLTLYTKYIPIVYPNVPTDNTYYKQNVAPFVNQVWPNMQACASSAAFSFQAKDGASIDNALQAMLLAALSHPSRFTQ
ncbi:MAG TPA: pilus assembly protein TadG-related protein [Rhodopila sp.]|nr:pilus assembly protein TadG-related protein [Rhodopila sp.]